MRYDHRFVTFAKFHMGSLLRNLCEAFLLQPLDDLSTVTLDHVYLFTHDLVPRQDRVYLFTHVYSMQRRTREATSQLG